MLGGSGLGWLGRRAFGLGAWCAGFRADVIIIFYEILYDQRDAAVGWIQGRIWLAKPLICESADLRYLIFADSILLHQAACGDGAIRGKLPIPIIGVLAKRL